jgi:hypothetical protein
LEEGRVLETLTMKPYVRLLKMIGEDLITNEKVALIELAKNAYDADASWVSIRFENFGPNYTLQEDSRIVIEDDGDGMTEHVIKEYWLNPATSYKKELKSKNPFTIKKRYIHGEKGIGHFAMLKLGRTIELHTRPRESNKDYSVLLDLSNYDEEFFSESTNTEDSLLERMHIYFYEKAESSFQEIKISAQSQVARSGHGTRLIISNLRGQWSPYKVKEVYSEIMGMRPVYPAVTEGNDLVGLEEDTFDLYFFNNDEYLHYREKYLENRTKYLELLEKMTFLEIKNGEFDDKLLKFTFEINGCLKEIGLDDKKITKLKVYKKYFLNDRDFLINKTLECGPFSFKFNIFEFERNINKAVKRYMLNEEQKILIKEHRVYLFRDGIRVYPYGEPQDDWLQIDGLRGTSASGDFFSNDQLVGAVDISHKNNPKLQDKTSREGLIDNGEAAAELKALLQIFLSYLKTYEFGPYKLAEKLKGTAGGSNAGTAGGSNAGTAGGSNAGTAGGSNAGTAGGSNAGTAGGSNAGTVGGSNAGTAGGSNAGTAGGSNAGTAGGSNAGTAGGSNAGTAGGSNAGTAGGSNAGTAGGSNAGTAGGSTEDIPKIFKKNGSEKGPIKLNIATFFNPNDYAEAKDYANRKLPLSVTHKSKTMDINNEGEYLLCYTATDDKLETATIDIKFIVVDPNNTQKGLGKKNYNVEIEPHYFGFTETEYVKFNFPSGELSKKIQEVIKELNMLDFNNNRIAIVSLFRILVELCCRKACLCYTDVTYREGDLAGNVNSIFKRLKNKLPSDGTNKSTFVNDTPFPDKLAKEFSNFINTDILEIAHNDAKKNSVIDMLNLYMHHERRIPNDVKEYWDGMKPFLLACLMLPS